MYQHHPDIDQLITRYLSRQASQAEKEVLEEWLKSSRQNRDTFDRLQKIWGMSLPDEYSTRMEGIRDQIWAAGTVEESPNKKKVRRGGFLENRWIKFAAVFVLVLTGVWFSAQILRDKSSTSPKPLSWVEKSNHAGQRSSHLLPDGSKVWLNVESRISFPEQFSDTLRQVQLVGEAYFEVVKDEKKRFVVNTAEVNMVVLGTSFNVRAYPEDDEVKIALLEGKVQVQTGEDDGITMAPGDEMVARKGDLTLRRQAFEYLNSFGWKEGVLVFDGVGFNGFKNSLEKWYGVKVEVYGEVPASWSIRARYRRESLQHVLEDISFNKNMVFELKGKKVTITF